jgi:hypothetical protein
MISSLMGVTAYLPSEPQHRFHHRSHPLLWQCANTEASLTTKRENLVSLETNCKLFCPLEVLEPWFLQWKVKSIANQRSKSRVKKAPTA